MKELNKAKELLMDKVPIEMDKVKPEPRYFKKYINGITYIIVSVIAVLSLVFLWNHLGRISTDYAVLDGQSYIVTTALDDTLQEILVSENQIVSHGQIVAIMSLYGNESANAQNMSQNSSLTLNNISNRVESFKKAESDIIERIAKLREEEAIKKQVFAQKVQAHVKAQLALRNLNANLALGEKASQSHISADKLVLKAKKEMEQAEVEFEESSLLRAGIESELMAMRKYTMSAERSNAHSANLPLNNLKKIKELSVIRAPADGKVINIFAQVGQKLIKHQPILQIAPLYAQELSVIAYFSKKQFEDIHMGQECHIYLKLEQELVLHGVVDNIDLAGHSKGQYISIDEQKLFPIIIKLTMGKDDNLQNIYPGMEASVTVLSRKVLGFF